MTGRAQASERAENELVVIAFVWRVVVGNGCGFDLALFFAKPTKRFDPQLMRALRLPDLGSIPDTTRVLCGGGIGELGCHNLLIGDVLEAVH